MFFGLQILITLLMPNLKEQRTKNLITVFKRS